MNLIDVMLLISKDTKLQFQQALWTKILASDYETEALSWLLWLCYNGKWDHKITVSKLITYAIENNIFTALEYELSYNATENQVETLSHLHPTIVDNYHFDIRHWLKKASSKAHFNEIFHYSLPNHPHIKLIFYKLLTGLWSYEGNKQLIIELYSKYLNINSTHLIAAIHDGWHPNKPISNYTASNKTQEAIRKNQFSLNETIHPIYPCEAIMWNKNEMVIGNLWEENKIHFLQTADNSVLMLDAHLHKSLSTTLLVAIHLTPQGQKNLKTRISFKATDIVATYILNHNTIENMEMFANDFKAIKPKIPQIITKDVDFISYSHWLIIEKDQTNNSTQLTTYNPYNFTYTLTLMYVIGSSTNRISYAFGAMHNGTLISVFQLSPQDLALYNLKKPIEENVKQFKKSKKGPVTEVLPNIHIEITLTHITVNPQKKAKINLDGLVNISLLPLTTLNTTTLLTTIWSDGNIRL